MQVEIRRKFIQTQKQRYDLTGINQQLITGGKNEIRMEKEGRAKKVSSSRENDSLQGFPLDLNLLHLQNSRNQEQIDYPRMAFNSSSAFSPRNKPNSLTKKNKAAKLRYSKSFAVPTLLSDEPLMSKEKARRSVSVPNTLELPSYGLGRFSFERPMYQNRKTTFYDNTEEQNVIDDNLHLSFKLPAIRINSTHCGKQGLHNKNKTASTAGKDFRLPYVKNPKFHGY